MSERKPLTSDEIGGKAIELVQGLEKDVSLSCSEIVMILDLAKIIQVGDMTIGKYILEKQQ